jgi:hypothetical protein
MNERAICDRLVEKGRILFEAPKEASSGKSVGDIERHRVVSMRNCRNFLQVGSKDLYRNCHTSAQGLQGALFALPPARPRIRSTRRAAFRVYSLLGISGFSALEP